MTRVDLGIDTGGTFTDAVLFADGRVLASAKALTTRQDLAVGIVSAAQKVLASAGVAPDSIGFAALSTTLATNALVEGHGQRAGLLAIGFAANDLARGGLAEALGSDPCLQTGGGHNHSGEEAAPLDLEAVTSWAKAQDVSAFAVAGQFATRNASHEQAAGRAIREATGKPVTLSHELSARLGGPKRALTALLNARLIGLTYRLIGRAEIGLEDLGITAPLMVVRGDGALMSAAQAKERPIETILSGPAASIVGGAWLTGQKDAIVSDIGGTTTDVALIRDGLPRIDPDGAKVGPFRTMVEAVAMRTHGLGGDSEVLPRDSGLNAGVTLGPARVLPVSLLAAEEGEVVHAFLEAHLQSPTPNEFDAMFVRTVPGVAAHGLTEIEERLLDRIGDAVKPVKTILAQRRERTALMRLAARGVIQRAGVTPTDAVHVLGDMSDWDRDAAEKALRLLARKRAGSGQTLAPSSKAMARMILDQLVADTGFAVLDAAFAEEDGWDNLDSATLANHPLLARALSGHRSLLRLDAGLAVPLIGLGASARCHYPDVGRLLNADLILPELAEVANAVGAVVGQIRVSREGSVTSPSEGRFRVHLENGPQDFADADQAIQVLEDHLKSIAEHDAKAAGAADLTVNVSRDIRQAEVENRMVLIEALFRVEASGRPRFAG